MTEEQLVSLSGRALFQRQLKALQDGRLTYTQLRATSEMWLRHRGYVSTSLGWWKADELSEMGVGQTDSGEWVIGTEERRRMTAKDRKPVVEVYHVPVRANAFFAKRRAANARFAGLLSAVPSQEKGSGNELVRYARRLFDGEGT